MKNQLAETQVLLENLQEKVNKVQKNQETTLETIDQYVVSRKRKHSEIDVQRELVYI